MSVGTPGKRGYDIFIDCFKRGALAGLLFGAFILIAHELSGMDAKAHLPEPAIILVAVTTVLGAAFGTLG